jgi:hypothetical protein
MEDLAIGDRRRRFGRFAQVVGCQHIERVLNSPADLETPLELCHTRTPRSPAFKAPLSGAPVNADDPRGGRFGISQFLISNRGR